MPARTVEDAIIDQPMVAPEHEVSQEEIISSLETYASHYKNERDRLESQLLSMTATAKRYAARNASLQAELDALRANQKET
jgi:hypothetical protein